MSKLTPEQRRARRLASYAKYNASRKGQQRDKKYEEAHPERRSRWTVLENYQRDRSA